MNKKLQYPCLAKRYFSTPNSNNDKPATTTTPSATTTTGLSAVLVVAATNNSVAGSDAGNSSEESSEETATTTAAGSSTASVPLNAAFAVPTTQTTIMMDGNSDHQSDYSSSSDDGVAHSSRESSPAWRVVPVQPTSSHPLPLVHRVDIQWKTRLDPFATYLDTSLYSPIIYQFEHELELENHQHAIIVVRPSVVYDDNQEIQVLNKNNQVILKGDLEIAMTAQKRNAETTVFKGHSKIQFTDSSYHHDRKAFRLVWKYYTVQDTERLIYSTISTPFRVFARKPTKKEKTETSSPNSSAATSPTQHNRKKRKEMEPSAVAVQAPTPVPTLVESSLESSTKKVKRDAIQVVDDDEISALNIRAVPTIVNSVATAVVSHLISQKENPNQDLVLELFKTLKDINNRLERLEKLSNPQNPTPSSNHADMMETSSTASVANHHHVHRSNLQHV
nr:unnamed protein product [Naegleria fowleri]